MIITPYDPASCVCSHCLPYYWFTCLGHVAELFYSHGHIVSQHLSIFLSTHPNPKGHCQNTPQNKTMASRQAEQTVITLRGSVATVVEFFGYAINSLLYQRGVYPAEFFTSVNKYKLQLLVTTDRGLKAYLGNVLQQLSEWLMRRMVQKLVLVISDGAGAVLERWQFDIDADTSPQASAKPEDAVQREIQAIVKQITATQTFLPLLPDECSFDLLVCFFFATKIWSKVTKEDASLVHSHTASMG